MPPRRVFDEPAVLTKGRPRPRHVEGGRRCFEVSRTRLDWPVLEPGANWTFDKSERPGNGLASKPHLAVGGPGEWNPQQLTQSPGHTESKGQLSHPLG